MFIFYGNKLVRSQHHHSWDFSLEKKKQHGNIIVRYIKSLLSISEECVVLQLCDSCLEQEHSMGVEIENRKNEKI